ncbi:hypothetical protein [Maritimibacter alkaliphilus]|uniref:hypothetical protein n=1 Tax=Maritimibacter alkaliphilus TaxID=404236 RepID=UPI001C953487|nr:hypothetical protein [Maritimibacter alkaliphilus]MBY6090903.1 hypothetical protein [Maritimibacter alkaliphilus]
MLRYATLCATLAVLLLTTLVSAQAPQTSGCGSARAQVDVCYAPGAALPDRAPAKKPCLSCALTDTAALPPGPLAGPLRHVVAETPQGSGRVIPPDARPPRA